MKDTNTLISIQLPKNLLNQIKIAANEKNLSYTAYIRLVLQEKLLENANETSRNKD